MKSQVEFLEEFHASNGQKFLRGDIVDALGVEQVGHPDLIGLWYSFPPPVKEDSRGFVTLPKRAVRFVTR